MLRCVASMTQPNPPQLPPPAPPSPPPAGRGFLARAWRMPVVVALLIGAFGAWQIASLKSSLQARFEERTNISHDIVVEQVRAVAKIVTSETTVRDVVTYENTRYGSTKRALVVATGRILAGMDLQAPPGAQVAIDHEAKRISVTLPPASVLAVDIMGLRTYDEQRGLWNPFEPEDRDAIYARVRIQLRRSAQELNLTEHANRSAEQMLKGMFGVNGYSVDVIFRAPPPVQPRG